MTAVIINLYVFLFFSLFLHFGTLSLAFVVECVRSRNCGVVVDPVTLVSQDLPFSPS